MAEPVRVLCLGSGYAAIDLAKGLRKAIRRGQVQLTVVGRESFHVFHGFIAEMLTGRIQPQQICSPARRLFEGARFVNAEVERIDTAGKRVTVSRLLDGQELELEYDHLVVALGAVDDLSRFPGIAAHTQRLKTYWDCFKTRMHLLSMLEMAEIATSEAERRKLLTFVIVGGGYGGIEVAAELVHYFETLARREYPGIRPEEISVRVVHSGERILPELLEHHPQLVDYAEKVLASSGLQFHLGVRLQTATAEEAHLSDGTVIPTRTIISSAGNAFPRVLDDLPVERTERGRIVVDRTCRVPSLPGVWAAGDNAALPHPKGGECPTVAVYAMWGGALIAKNILRELSGKALRPFTFTGLGDACALGRRRAVSQVKGVRFYGLPAWLVWRSFFLYFVPLWDRKLRILLDWFLTPVFGRDIVNVRIDEPYGVRSELYEPGQDIVRQGDVGRNLYAIWKGEADVIHREPDGAETILATLRDGDHFGEVAVFQNRRRTATVRARTRVEVLSIGRSEALALSSTVLPFGEVVRRRPEAEAPPA